MENPFQIIEQRLEAIELGLKQLQSSVISNIRNIPDQSDDKQKFSITELSVYLKVSKSTIHRYKNNKMFPFYQAGRTVFFKKIDVDEAMLTFKNRRMCRQLNN